MEIVFSCRQNVRQKLHEMDADSLRPSKHACAAMPHSYAGVGFSTKNAGSMSTRSSTRSQNGHIPSGQQPGDPGNSNSTISYDSTTYDMPEEEVHVGYQNGFIINRMGDEMTDSESGLISNEFVDSGRSLSPIMEEDSTRNSEISVDSSLPGGQSVLPVNMRPRSLENTKGEPENRPPPVDYALFKGDDTGNLENYLDARRVSV